MHCAFGWCFDPSHPSKRSQSWRLPRTFPFSNCFRPAQLARWSAFPPLQDGSPARRHPRHRLRYLQLGHVRAPGARRSAHDFARRRCPHLAHRPVLQRGRAPHALWAGCDCAVPGRHRRPPDAFAQKPAGQRATAGQDSGAPAVDQLPGRHQPVSAHAGPEGAGRSGRYAGACGDGSPGAFCG